MLDYPSGMLEMAGLRTLPRPVLQAQKPLPGSHRHLARAQAPLQVGPGCPSLALTSCAGLWPPGWT